MFKNRFIPLIALMVIVAVTLVYVQIGSAALTAPTTMTLTETNTTMRVQLTGAVDQDSLVIMRIDAADDTTKWAIATTQTDTTITGMSPNTYYAWGAYVQGTGGVRSFATFDTLWTARPEIERFPRELTNKGIVFETMMKGARAWRTSKTQFDTLYTAKEDNRDSTMIYNAAAYTAIQVYPMQSADSIACTYKVYTGHAEETNLDLSSTTAQGGSWWFNQAADDSFTVSKEEPSQIHKLDIPPGQHFYIVTQQDADSGFNTTHRVRLYRIAE